jgi:hypothetical protein
MTSGPCSSRSSTRRASAVASTPKTCEPWWTPCSTSPRPGVSGATSRRRSGPGRGSGRSSAAGRATAPWAQALTVLHAAARIEDGRTDESPSMVVIDAHLARGVSNGGFTFHNRGGPYGRTKGAKRVVAVDVTGLPVAALVVPASTHENRASELMLEHLTKQGVTDRLELVLVDRRVTAAAARDLSAGNTTSRSVGSGGTTSSRSSAPSGMPGASRSPTATSDAPAGWRSRSRTPPSRRPAGSWSRASPRRCATCHESEPVGVLSRPQLEHTRSRTRGMRHERTLCRHPLSGIRAAALAHSRLV